MKDDLFNELVASVREGGAILRDEVEAARITNFDDPDVAAIRDEYGLSQTKFAALLGRGAAHQLRVGAGARLRAREPVPRA